VDKKNYLQAGKIVNTHGIHGELKLNPWADSPAFLANINTFYIDEKPIKIINSRVHKNFLLVTPEGVNDFNDAIKYKNKIVYINRDDVNIDEGRYFVADLIGLNAVNVETDENIGIISDILMRPANDVYVITDKHQKEILVPAVPEFIKEVNIENGYIKLRLIEGM
jgi:16S rRNA processing protein RimM